MKRKIVSIDEERCIGCGLCITGCHEGALKLVNGKAKLVSDAYCDGLGACLPACPVNAIILEERDAEAFDEVAVKARMALSKEADQRLGGCPGVQAKLLEKETAAAPLADKSSELRQWPCQIKLVPVNAPYFAQAELLIAADCTAYAYANIHQQFMRNKITLIGCPKLDEGDYTEKLAAIIAQNQIKNVTVLRMEVPCCGALVLQVQQAIVKSGKKVACQVVIIGTDGTIIE
ncbi:MAG: 4Fe-4S binding protein [Pelosinus sp.]|nr:4Fe-4S binding protein [Pelosinus sp.]